MRRPAMKFGFKITLFTDREVIITAKRYGYTVTGQMKRDDRTNAWGTPRITAVFHSLNPGEAERMARVITSLSALMRKCWLDAAREESPTVRLPSLS